MYGIGNNHQFFIIAFQLLESILTKIAGVSFFSMNEQHGTADFIGIRKDRCVEKCKIGGFVPAQTGVDGTRMITSFGLVIIIIILHELRRITGRFRVRHGAGISVGTVVFRALGVKLLTHFVTCICIVSGIEVTVCCTAANVVHCGSYRCLDTCVVGSRIDSKTTPTTNANDADSFGIHIRTCRKVIHRRREVFGVDVWRSYAARLSTAFTSK